MTTLSLTEEQLNTIRTSLTIAQKYHAMQIEKLKKPASREEHRKALYSVNDVLFEIYDQTHRK